ncbi:Mitochondrial amidoxime-reducing component 1 [Liparis tanakae]|uniref:Mitochondrial amidoxime-reducing component 1 n=1 Tax=Liparis tanakae TaxID=230148 RepID=A0A4Z2GD77_9TELE|nr:Mitochondrial amidoxime-reducing component 1 [Liparis tanakae]
MLVVIFLHWLVVTEDGHMVTGRQEPAMVLVSLTCEGDQLCLNGPNMEELRFLIQQSDNAVVDCRVFGEHIQGRDCGDEASRWLTRYLGEEKTFRLVHYEPQMTGRRPEESKPLPRKMEEVAYSDAGPVMLLSQSSVTDLNNKCIFTTVDPETGVITRKEPLETLKSYRQCEPSDKQIYKSSPLFGQLHNVKKTGFLQVGDVVYKISR